MLKEGIYEQLITQSLEAKLKLSAADTLYIHRQPIDKEEASKILAEYLTGLIKFALKELKGEDALQKQIIFCNQILAFIQDHLELDLYDSLVDIQGQLLTAVLSKIGKTDKQLQQELERKLPISGLTVSSLFTGSNADRSIDTEIEKDILSADSIQWIVSFIKWSGLRIFDKALREFTSRPDASLKIITTSYMGATEAKALSFLAELPRTEIKISYQTKIERLHAKAYIFERNTGFDTAYIGSSNLSRSALTKGLEWNLRVTTHENKHIVEKAKATFDHYWNSIDFEDFRIGGVQKFREAVARERDNGQTFSIDSYFKISPFPFQKEILEKLTIERNLHQRFRNLIVAATGTGKTVISAFDFKRFNEERKGKANLLFIAHRKEILEQARSTFRGVLGAGYREFGELWIGNYTPTGTDLSNLFISIQTLNSQKELLQSRLAKDFYDFIIIDEAHHSQAETYRIIFDIFQPQILLGLTATPERMDGRSLLPDFDNKIAAEIRLPDALSLKLLSPFQYFCISDDSVDLRNVKWTAGGYDTKELTLALTKKQRAALIINAIEQYLTDPFEAKALGFCSSKDHAAFMAEAFIEAGLKATYLVSGGDASSQQERETIKQKLARKEVNFVFVVDIFNEGVDIPEIDTVLFLRPTESLTVFLQQLGRGLRLYENKDCLTVLDFVSQAHTKYNFASKFRALVGKSNQNIQREIESGFPHLPAGCNIQLEKQAREYILENIKDAIFDARRLQREVADFEHQTGRQLTLSSFLDYHDLDIRTLYKPKHYWSAWKRDAGFIQIKETAYHTQIASGFRRLVHVDSFQYLAFIQRLIKNNFDLISPSEEERKLALMFYYDIWQQGISKFGFTNIYEGIKDLNNHQVLKVELSEIVAHLLGSIHYVTKKVHLGFANVLELHAQYTRDQILCAFNKTTPDRPFPSREGVVNIPELNTEILLVTLNKTDKDFSASTQYEDYAISETIFHWQTQNSTSPESPVGLSYIKHSQQGKKLLLFVREEKKDAYGFTMPYHFLGPVNYISHRGAKPMSINWELKEPLPAYLWKAAAKMAVG